MRESTFEAKFGKMVKRLGGLSYKWVSPGNAGVPDRIVFFPPGTWIGETLVEGIWFVELKSTKGKLTPRQVHQHDLLRQRGARVITLWPWHTAPEASVKLQFMKAVCLYRARLSLEEDSTATPPRTKAVFVSVSNGRREHRCAPRTKVKYVDVCTSIEEV